MRIAAERRLHPRVAVEGVTAKLVFSNGSQRARRVEIIDLSLDGVRWRDTEPAEPGTRVSVSLRTRRLFGASIHLEAVVVRGADLPTAAQFLVGDGRARLEQYLRSLRSRLEPAPSAAASPLDAAAAFRLLGIGLERAGDTTRVIVVASARPGDGSSFVAAGAAASLAAMGHDVLLVDAGLHAPTQHLRFAGRGAPGVAQLLARPGVSQLREMIQQTASGVALLPAGAAGAGPGSFSPDAVTELGALVRGLGYPLVIIDGPPILTSAETLLLGRIADDTLLTVRAGVTRERDVKQALDLLARNGTPATGVVLNDYKDATDDMRFWMPALASGATVDVPAASPDAAAASNSTTPVRTRSAAV